MKAGGMIGFSGNCWVAGRRSRCWGGSRDRPWQRGGVDVADCRRESVRLERGLLALTARAVRSDR